jgi:hypothetical protein
MVAVAQMNSDMLVPQRRPDALRTAAAAQQQLRFP